MLNDVIMGVGCQSSAPQLFDSDRSGLVSLRRNHFGSCPVVLDSCLSQTRKWLRLFLLFAPWCVGEVGAISLSKLKVGWNSNCGIWTSVLDAS